MLKTQKLQTSVFEIGEDIGYALGKKMVEDFQSANPNEVHSFLVGKKILTEILNQIGCDGIQLYNAYNEKGEQTLVYVGTDSNRKNIFEIPCVNEAGVLSSKPAIVADRVITGKPGGPVSKPGAGLDASPEGWEWTVD